MKFNLKYKACMCNKMTYHDYSATTICGFVVVYLYGYIKYNPNKFTNVRMNLKCVRACLSALRLLKTIHMK